MSPAIDAARSLRALLAEIRADRLALDHHRAAVDTTLVTAPWPAGDPLLSVVAVSIHHYYCGVEAIFERVARRFEGLPAGQRWHRDLLDAMQLNIDGVRPALISRELRSDLGQLLGFRHFFRHAYAVAFDPSRLEDTARILSRAHRPLGAALDAFDATLRAALAAAGD